MVTGHHQHALRLVGRFPEQAVRALAQRDKGVRRSLARHADQLPSDFHPGLIRVLPEQEAGTIYQRVHHRGVEERDGH